MANIYGWLSPRGNFAKREKYKHLKDLENLPDLSEEIKNKFSIWAERLNRIRESCRSLIAEGEHPEWHRYEMAESDCQYEAVELLKKEGFVRVAQYGTEMYFDGSPTDLQKCKDFAEQHGCEAIFERR